MASKSPLYPEVIQTIPDAPLPNPNASQSKSRNLYPSIDMEDLVENLFPDDPNSPSAPPLANEEVLITVPGAIVHLIDKQYSVELACGDLTIARLRQNDNIVALLVRVGDEIQWPLAKDEAVVKVDDARYFFSIKYPTEDRDDCSSDEEEKGKKKKKKKDKKKKEKKDKKKEEDFLNYGLTIASKGQEGLVTELERILKESSSFSEHKVSEEAKKKGESLLDGSVAKGMSPSELVVGEKKELMEKNCAGYWTTLAPNVEDYSSTAARFIATGSGHLIKGILWCGDVTVERLKWGNEVMKRRMSPGANKEISPDTLKRIKRVKKMTKMTQKVANGVLSGVVKVSGFFTGKLANSKAGKKLFGLLPGEVVLASLDGFNKLCDALEVAGKNVMSTSSTVTTELVNHKYGEEAAKATNEGMGAAGHAIGAVWAAFKIRKALNPKSALKSSNLAKTAVKVAASEIKSKK